MGRANARRRRSDAVGNLERILTAARESLRELGSTFSYADVAERAGIGVATVYRHVESRERLVAMVFERIATTELEEALTLPDESTPSDNALWSLVESLVRLLTNEPWLVGTFIEYGSVTDELSSRIFDPLSVLLERAQAEELVRSDLVSEDLPVLVMMILSAAYAAPAGADGWQRYSHLLRESIRPDAVSGLPLETVAPFKASAIKGRTSPFVGRIV